MNIGEAVFTLNTRDWGDYGSQLVSHSTQEVVPKIPGCTAGRPDAKNWDFSASTFIAYASMRGSGMEAGNPLQTWMSVKGMEKSGTIMSPQAGSQRAASFNIGQLRR